MILITARVFIAAGILVAVTGVFVAAGIFAAAVDRSMAGVQRLGQVVIEAGAEQAGAVIFFARQQEQ